MKKSRIIIEGRKLRIPIHFKMFLKDGRVLSYVGTKKSQIRSRLKAVPHQNVEKYYLKVTYGKALNNFNKMITFDNSGEWTNRKELLHALTAFTEGVLLKDWIEK